MKRFIILSLTACLLLVANKAWACAGGDYGHYAEVFNIYSHTYTYDNSERLMQYWINYTGDRTPLSGKWKEERYYPLGYFFEKDCARLFAAAKKKHDEEMLLYLRQTIKYNTICKTDGIIPAPKSWLNVAKRCLACSALQRPTMVNA